MKNRLLKPVCFVFALNLVSVAFSQKIRGVYEPVYRPKDAPPYTGSEFPVKLTKATFRLKAFHRLKFIETNLDGSNPRVSKGKWSSSGKNIHMEIGSDGLQKWTMERIQLKSGTYIKLVNDYFYYYKKQ